MRRPRLIAIASGATRGAQPFGKSELDQHARRVRRKLDAGAGLFQPLRLLEQSDAEAARASVSAAVSPPMPAPAMMTLREAATARRRAVRPLRQGARRWACGCGSSAGSWRYSVEQ